MTPVLEVRELVKEYPGVRAVDGVSFSIAEGQCFGLSARTAPARRRPSK
jgi:ABC-2 type transport system ATP-binding protein